jgi:hypothetical protein
MMSTRIAAFGRRPFRGSMGMRKPVLVLIAAAVVVAGAVTIALAVGGGFAVGGYPQFGNNYADDGAGCHLGPTARYDAPWVANSTNSGLQLVA